MLADHHGSKAFAGTAAGNTAAGFWPIKRAVCRANQVLTGKIEEIAVLPVQFDGNVPATVEIGVGFSLKANDEGDHVKRRAASADLATGGETHPLAPLDKVFTAADEVLGHLQA